MQICLVNCTLFIVVFQATRAIQCESRSFVDVEDSLCKDNSCLEIAGRVQKFGLTRKVYDDAAKEECDRIKLACIKANCFISWDKAGGPFSKSNPCRSVVLQCKGIDPKESLAADIMKDKDPFLF